MVSLRLGAPLTTRGLCGSPVMWVRWWVAEGLEGATELEVVGGGSEGRVT